MKLCHRKRKGVEAQPADEPCAGIMGEPPLSGADGADGADGDGGDAVLQNNSGTKCDFPLLSRVKFCFNVYLHEQLRRLCRF